MQIHLLSGTKGWFFLIKQKPITVRTETKVIIQNRCVCFYYCLSFFHFSLCAWLSVPHYLAWKRFTIRFHHISRLLPLHLRSALFSLCTRLECTHPSYWTACSAHSSACSLSLCSHNANFYIISPTRSRWLSVNGEICSFIVRSLCLLRGWYYYIKCRANETWHRILLTCAIYAY